MKAHSRLASSSRHCLTHLADGAAEPLHPAHELLEVSFYRRQEIPPEALAIFFFKYYKMQRTLKCDNVVMFACIKTEGWKRCPGYLQYVSIGTLDQK